MKENEKIRERRETLGLSIAQLAEMAGVGSAHLALVETGRRPLTQKFERRISAILAKIEGKRKEAPTTIIAHDFAANGDASIIQSPGATNNARVTKACPATEPHWVADLRTKLDALAADHAIIKDLLLKLAAK